MQCYARLGAICCAWTIGPTTESHDFNVTNKVRQVGVSEIEFLCYMCQGERVRFHFHSNVTAIFGKQ